LNAKQWFKKQLGVWEFFYEKRDIRDKTVHPATFPISMAKGSDGAFYTRGGISFRPFCW